MTYFLSFWGFETESGEIQQVLRIQQRDLVTVAETLEFKPLRLRGRR